MPGAEKLLLTVDDLRGLLGLGRRQCYELVSRSDFPVLRFGRSIRIPREALEHWIKENTSKGALKI